MSQTQVNMAGVLAVVTSVVVLAHMASSGYEALSKGRFQRAIGEASGGLDTSVKKQVARCAYTEGAAFELIGNGFSIFNMLAKEGPADRASEYVQACAARFVKD